MRRIALFVVVALLWAAAYTRDRFDDYIDATVLPVLVHETSSEVRDRSGHLLRAYTIGDGRWRLDVSLDQVDPIFVDMLTAYEDKRFFDHPGIDVIAMSRAVGQALRYGKVVSGGSTLTMQVARLLEDSGTGAMKGKLRQMRVALALERQLSKEEILQLYLLLAPYGGNIEGLRAASLAWLGKEPRRLTPAEAALLVALPQAPESRRPDRHPDRANAARDRVLQRMAGAGVISQEDATAGLLDPSPRGRRNFPMLAPHLADRIVAETPGRHRVTLDGQLQKTLEQLALRHMESRDPNLSLALMVADHSTGEILASVGSPGYSQDARRMGYVDMTMALRSPGSTLKPLVYALAFDRGMAHPETIISDTPVRFGSYAPENFDGQYRGDIRIAEALQHSLNIPVVRLTEKLGPAHVMTALRRMGITAELQGNQPGLAVVLGGVGLRLRDLMQLYATLSQGGRAVRLSEFPKDPSHDRVQIVEPRAAWMVGHVLSGIRPPAASGPAGRIAFKTGTSYGHRDAWAIGYDGQYVVGVWTGRPDGTAVPGTFGADAAAPLLFEVLTRTRQDAVALPPPPPDTLLLSNAALPRNLQRFGKPVEQVSAIEVTFPPSGARLAATGDVVLKLRHGEMPYTVLADGEVVATGQRAREFSVPVRGPGFVTLSVIDALGQSDRVELELR